MDWWIASDLGELALGGALPENHVLGVGGASLTLAGLQLGRSSGLALDLGTGCGIQALHASRYSGRVIATDISQRALDFAAFNAALNGIRTIEFRLGDMFEPVAGEHFDYIVTQSAVRDHPAWRRGAQLRVPRRGQGGRRDRGGGHCGRRASPAAGRGGPAARKLGVPHGRGGAAEDGLDRIGGWIDAAGLDGWVIEREVQDPALYAQTWIRDGGIRAGAESDRLEDAWLDDFEARGVTAVGFGYVLLRSRPERRVCVAANASMARFPGASARNLASTLTAFDWQAELDDDALARAMLVVAPDVTEERHYWPGDEHPAVMNLRQGGGFARSYPLGTALAAVVGACDGELSVGAICSAVSQLLEVDEAELVAEVLPALREFVTVGMLVPEPEGREVRAPRP